MSLWDDKLGEACATLKILGDHGVTQEDWGLIRSDPKGMGIAVADAIRSRAAQQPAIHILPMAGDFSSLETLSSICCFSRRSEHRLQIQRVLTLATDPLDPTRTFKGEAAVFHFEQPKICAVIPEKRIEEITERMKRAGYQPAPLGVFLAYLPRDWNIFVSPEYQPLVCLDPRLLHMDKRNVPLVTKNDGHRPSMSQTWIGDLEVRQKYFYLAWKNS